MVKAKEGKSGSEAGMGMGYNAMIERIQELTDEINDPNGDVDNMIANVEEAVRLIKECRTRLARTGVKVKSAIDLLNQEETASDADSEFDTEK